MKPEMIELYRAVQRFRGEWKPFDPVLYKGQPGTITDNIGGQMEIFIPKSVGGYYQWVGASDPDLLWLPPVYSDDERCLVRMICGAVEMFRNDLGTWGVNCWSGKEMYFPATAIPSPKPCSGQ